MSESSVSDVAAWEEYRGQGPLKTRLMVHAQAALAEGRLLDDMLFVAPPGSGKTTLARLVANLVKDPFHLFMMPTDVKAFCQFCRRWEGGVLLLDEIHSAPTKFQELLYTAIGQTNKMLYPPAGPPIDVNHITFIAATTEPDKIPGALWTRFKVKPQWDLYSDTDMALIISDAARRINVTLPAGLADELALATGGTPRLAGVFVAACRDLAANRTPLTVDAVLDLVGVDSDGLTRSHLDYLSTLYTLNGTSGLRNICSLLQLPTQAVEELERTLLQRGLITLGSSGRSLTEAGYDKVPGTKTRPSLQGRRAS